MFHEYLKWCLESKTFTRVMVEFLGARYSTAGQRNGEGVPWPDLDKDISVENILLGKPSGDSAASFRRWLCGRS